MKKVSLLAGFLIGCSTTIIYPQPPVSPSPSVQTHRAKVVNSQYFSLIVIEYSVSESGALTIRNVWSEAPDSSYVGWKMKAVLTIDSCTSSPCNMVRNQPFPGTTSAPNDSRVILMDPICESAKFCPPGTAYVFVRSLGRVVDILVDAP